MIPFDVGTWAGSLGWTLAGVSGPKISADHVSKTLVWLGQYKGPQMNYLSRRSQERLDPRAYFAPTQSILSFGLFYFKGWAQGSVKVSNYAWGEDYHTLLKEKLETTAQALISKMGMFDYRISVDTAPVLEKSVAISAGLGWQGKNTLVIHPIHGSLFFLGEIFTSLPIEMFQAKLPMNDHCGTCNRCVEACPTKALTPYVLDAQKCISYWTLEHKGAFDSTTPDYTDWVAGCDICQEVCPWNQKLVPLESSREFEKLSAADIESNSWTARIKNSAASYVPQKNWARNLGHINA